MKKLLIFILLPLVLIVHRLERVGVRIPRQMPQQCAHGRFWRRDRCRYRWDCA